VALSLRNPEAAAMLLKLRECPSERWPGIARTTAWHVAAGVQDDSLAILLLNALMGEKRDSICDDELFDIRPPGARYNQSNWLRDAAQRTPFHYAAMGEGGARMSFFIQTQKPFAGRRG
jgi:hypothetical protein